MLCTACRFELPKPGLFLEQPNWISHKLDGLIEYDRVHAYFLFSEGGKVQHLLHQIKYKGQEKLGEYLGACIGRSFTRQEYDVIIPMPLHPSRRRERGYNQAACIAKGIARESGIPFLEDNLVRNKQVSSLIGLNRAERYATLEEAFEVLKPDELDGLRILLVDDTMTTGATFLAAGAKIKAASTGKLSFLALAALK
ncbi:ComF family protein [Aquirufa novilacunae]|jgi:ComF family protein|uniref:ComF family protein n=1 Tax=Aquirufa novilacunae TaxID=3139305 RepID=A0ABW8U2V5_9BACT